MAFFPAVKFTPRLWRALFARAFHSATVGFPPGLECAVL